MKVQKMRIRNFLSKKSLATLLLIAIVSPNLYYASFQFKGREAEGAYSSLNRINNIVSKRDLLLIIRKNFSRYYYVMTPLSYYFGLNIFAISSFKSLEQSAPLFNNYFTQYDAIYLLSPEPVKSQMITYVTPISYCQKEYLDTATIPMKKVVNIKYKYYLYRLDQPLRP